MDRESADSIKLLRVSSVDSSQGAGHVREDCLQCCRRKCGEPLTATCSSSRSECFNSSESSFSDESDRIRASILRHVQRMANPVWSKQSRTQLLDLKQKHASAFQDICLYSEVCLQLGRNTYRLGSRRFLQELFLDLDFESFYREPGEISASARLERRPSDDESGPSSVVSPKVPKKTTSVMKSVNGRTPNQETSNKRNDSSETNGKSVNNAQTGPSGTNGASVVVLNSKPLHLRSPPLASLYETSVENIAEMSSTPKESATLRAQVALGQMQKVIIFISISLPTSKNHLCGKFYPVLRCYGKIFFNGPTCLSIVLSLQYS